MPPEKDPSVKEKPELFFDSKMLDIDEISRIDPIPGDISFYVNNNVEAMKICANGDFYVHGNKVTNDKKVYEGIVNFLKEAGHYD